MNTIMKRVALAAAFMVWATASFAQQANDWAHDFESVTPQGDTLWYVITDTTLHHVSVRDSWHHWNEHWDGISRCSDTLVIPSTVEHDGITYTVTALYQAAFAYHGEIKSIVIPATVTSIGDSALAFSGIVELTVHDGVDTIGPKAFCFIKNVIYHGTATGAPWGALAMSAYEENGIFYPDSTRTRVVGCRPGVTQALLPSSVRTIEPTAFSSIGTLETVTLPEGLDSIGWRAFYRCSSLGSVVIPSTVRVVGDESFCVAFNPDGSATVTIADAECSIGSSAFGGSGMGAIDLGNRITSIGDGAFEYCYNIDTIIVPNSCTYIGSWAFADNSNLKKIHLPEGLDTIHAGLLAWCFGLEEVIIPSSVVYIDSMAFWHDSSLTEITLSDNLTYIGDGAFSECINLTELTLPASLTYIGKAAFYWCWRIQTIRSLATTPPQAFWSTFDYINFELLLIVPCHSGDAYAADPYWSYFSNIEEDCTGVPTAEAPQATIRTIEGGITLEGCTGYRIRIFDTGGRLIAETTCNGTCTLRLPAGGIYMVQIADHPARKVVVQ